MVISQRNNWRIHRVIQFNEASLSNSSLNDHGVANFKFPTVLKYSLECRVILKEEILEISTE